LIRDASGIIVLEAEAEYSPFMPAKLADILKERKPVIAITPPYSEVRDILGSEYPYIADSRSIAEISRMLRRFLDDNAKGQVTSKMLEVTRLSLTPQGQSSVLMEIFS
jgi:hypothetical protein